MYNVTLTSFIVLVISSNLLHIDDTSDAVAAL